MEFLKALHIVGFTLLLFYLTAPQAFSQSQTRLFLHYHCTAASAAKEVAQLVDQDQIVYGVTALPSGCQWTTGKEITERIGTLKTPVDSYVRANGDLIIIGRFDLNGVLVYSAGYMDLTS